MARRRTRFKVSIQGFSIEYEGDEEQGMQFGASVTQGLATLASLPSQFMARQNETDASEKTINARFANNGDAKEPPRAIESSGKARRSRKPKGDGPQGQIEALVNSGFFTAWRTAEDVATELSKQGFTYRADALSTPLTRLTQRHDLVRDKLDEEKRRFSYKNP